MTFKSEHNLKFKIAPFALNIDLETPWMRFKVGTCGGLWRATESSYEILALVNDKPGNGHFNDVLQWFEQSCRRDNKTLRVMEVWNTQLKTHLIEKRGFKDIGNDNVELKYE